MHAACCVCAHLCTSVATICSDGANQMDEAYKPSMHAVVMVLVVKMYQHLHSIHWVPTFVIRVNMV